MQIAMNVDGDGDVVAQLLDYLRCQPALALVNVRRSPAEVGRGELGVAEVLAFVATEVSLPLVLDAVYSFFSDRRRSRRAERVRVVLVRTDLPDGTRTIEFRLDGPLDAAVHAVRAAFGEESSVCE